MTYIIQGDNARPTLIICLSFTKLLTFPSLVLNIWVLISHAQIILTKFFHLQVISK